LIYNESDYLDFIYKLNNSTALFMQTSALSFKKEYLQKILPLKDDGNILIWPDIRLSTESIFNGEIFTINVPLTKYRVHNLNDSKKLLDQLHVDNFYKQYNSFLNLLAKKYDMPCLQYNLTTKNKLKSIGLVLFSKKSLANKLFFINGMLIKLPIILSIYKTFNK